MKSLQNLISNCAQKITLACSTYANAEQETWWFLEHVTNLSRTQLLILSCEDFSKKFPELQQQLEAFIIDRTVYKKPLAYIIGHVPFSDLTINVRPPILIPRPETEEWVTWVINQYKIANASPTNVLDLCTGTGCIALKIASSFPKAQVTGVDINPQAIALAQENQRLNKISNVNFLEGDLFEPVTEKRFDFIVANPPYLTSEEWSTLEPDVANWEDKQALIAANNGMEVYNRIFIAAHDYLGTIDNPKHQLPRLVLEIGPAQHDIEKLAKAHNFKKIDSFVDFSGKKRWLSVAV